MNQIDIIKSEIERRIKLAGDAFPEAVSAYEICISIIDNTIREHPVCEDVCREAGEYAAEEYPITSKMTDEEKELYAAKQVAFQQGFKLGVERMHKKMTKKPVELENEIDLDNDMKDWRKKIALLFGGANGEQSQELRNAFSHFYELGRQSKEQIVCGDDEKYISILEGFLNTCWGEYFLLHEREDFQNWIENRLKPIYRKQEVCEGLKEEIERYQEEHFEYNSEFDSIRLKGGYLPSPQTLENIALHFYELGRSEKPNNHSEGLDVTDFCQPIHPDIAKVLPDVMNELIWGEDKNPVCEELEEAAFKYADAHCVELYKLFETHYDKDKKCLISILTSGDVANINQFGEDAFKAGSKWQKEKDESIYRKFFNDRNQGDASFYDLLAYREGHRDGMDEQKEQMMKNMVEGRVCAVYPLKDGNDVQYGVLYPKGVLPHKDGQKVRIIIIN